MIKMKKIQKKISVTLSLFIKCDNIFNAVLLSFGRILYKFVSFGKNNGGKLSLFNCRLSSPLLNGIPIMKPITVIKNDFKHI